MISDVYEGKLHPRIAAGLAPLMHLQLRVLETTEFEKRLGKLEQLIREVIMENRKESAAGRKVRKGLNPADMEHPRIGSLTKVSYMIPLECARCS